MFCKFVETTGDFMMFDSGLVDAAPVREATHEEIPTFYLHWEMYHSPGAFADDLAWCEAHLVERPQGWRQGMLL